MSTAIALSKTPRANPDSDDAQNNPAYYYQDNTRDPVEDAVVQVFHADGSPAAPLDGLPIDSMVINDGHPPDNQVPYFITSCQLGLITFRVDANDGNTYHMTTDDGVEHATCTVDSTAPELSCFGQLSLDAAKLWNCASPCNIPDAAM